MRPLRARMACAVENADLRQRLDKALTHTIAAREDRVRERADWEALRDAAAARRRHALERLPDLLEEFERNATASGARVHYAQTAGEATDLVAGFTGRPAAPLVKSKSMVTEEIGLRIALAGAGIAVVETDLGEYVIQLANSTPSHIVAPVIHLSAGDIARVFRSELGLDIPEDNDPRTISLAARAHLRDAFLRAEVGMCGANFLTAAEGAVVVCTNEGNAGLCTSLPRRLIVVAGIEKVMPDLASLHECLVLLASSSTGQRQNCYLNILRGPRAGGEPDGPDSVDIVLLDNGRSALLGDDGLWESLACIRCGACLNACPVYGVTGGQAYGWVYPGPIGIVLSPFLGSPEGRAMADACTLCGACGDVCPVRIDLPACISHVRARGAPRLPGIPSAAAAAFSTSPFGLLAGLVRARSRRQGRVRLGPARAWSLGRELPPCSGVPFRRLWRDEGGDDE